MSNAQKNENPGTNNAGGVLLSKNSSFSVQEAYKTLRTNVMFSLPGSECKCIGVTSPMPGECKSTTSANLAICLAQIKKRVLLIDCDMRLPTISSKFNIPAVPGLSDYLVGQARIEETIRKAADYDLFILPSGSIPPDSTGLLEAKQIEYLFAALRKNYDFVIVDLPPVITVPDALILAKHLDGFLLVIRENMTDHRAIAESIKQLDFASTKILGIVCTDHSTQEQKMYRNYRNYKYRKYSKYQSYYYYGRKKF